MALAIILAVYISLWAVIISMWAVFGALAICPLGTVARGIMFCCNGYISNGIAMIGTALVCAGLAIFTFYACKASTKGILIIPKKLATWMRNCFIKKEEAK